MLKLIVTNAHSFNGNVLPQGIEAKFSPFDDSFISHFQELSPNLYIFRVKGYAHELSCEIPLEVTETFVSLKEEGEEGGYSVSAVFVSFPAMNLEKLNREISFDSYVQGTLVRQFQLNILEQLLLFCDEKEAAKLILTISDTEWDYLDIYSRFFASEEQIVTSKGTQTQVVIPTDRHTYDEIIDLMGKIEEDCRRILWCKQNTNSAFRKYLKSNACL